MHSLHNIEEIGDIIRIDPISDNCGDDFKDDNIFKVISEIYPHSYMISSIKSNKCMEIASYDINRYYYDHNKDIKVTYLRRMYSKEKESDIVITYRNIKYDCSTVKDYRHEVKRMHDYYNIVGNNVQCPFFNDAKRSDYHCDPDLNRCFSLNVNRSDIMDRVNKLQKWSDEHPERTETSVDLTERRKTVIYNLAINHALDIIKDTDVHTNKESKILDKVYSEISDLIEKENEDA